MVDSDDEENVSWRSTVASQFSGILPYYEAFYLHSIIYAAERSEKAFKDFDKSLRGNGTAVVVFNSLQEALTHAGALSRFFWPVKKEDTIAAARGKKLRDAFQLDDKSALKWRRLRNAFEHFDEDLDRFLLEERFGYFFPAPMLGSQELADDQLGNIFKLVDPINEVCVLLGQKYQFGPIKSEVRRILLLASNFDSNGSRLPGRS